MLFKPQDRQNLKAEYTIPRVEKWGPSLRGICYVCSRSALRLPCGFIAFLVLLFCSTGPYPSLCNAISALRYEPLNMSAHSNSTATTTIPSIPTHIYLQSKEVHKPEVRWSRKRVGKWRPTTATNQLRLRLLENRPIPAHLENSSLPTHELCNYSQLEPDFHGCPGLKKEATPPRWFVGALMKLLWGTLSFVNFPVLFGGEPPTVEKCRFCGVGSRCT
jgi:hypothetical protein